jgi:hypothetical protein
VTIEERIARLRALAVSRLAEKRLGVDLSPGEALALADGNSISDALILLERRMERKPFAYAPLKSKPMIISGDPLGAKTMAAIGDEHTKPPFSGRNQYRYPPTKRVVGQQSVSIAAISVLSIAGVWCYLVAAIAAQSSLISGRDMPNVAISLSIAGFAIALGLRSGALVSTAAAIVGSRPRWSLHLGIAFLGVLAFLVFGFAAHSTGFQVDTLIRPYALLIWLGVTLSAFTVLRPTRPGRE